MPTELLRAPMSSPDMIPFSDCRRCMQAPREQFGWVGSDKVGEYPDVEAVWRMPGSLGLAEQPSHGLWRCRDCGTYYGFDVFNRGWPQGSCQTYLWRLAPAEAMEKYRWAGEEELRRHEERLPEWMSDMQACLGHPDSAVRERAAQHLASHFRARSELDGVEALLGHADASVRRGALLAFDSIRFVSLERGPADLVPALVKSLTDPDASVAREAFALLSRVGERMGEEKKRERILDQVSAIPAARRTAAVRMFLFTQSPGTLVAGLSDSGEEVRQAVLSKAFKWSIGNSDFVERLRTQLRAVPQANRTPEMEVYLAQENPECLNDD